MKPEYGTHSFAWGIRDSQSGRGTADYSVLPSPIAKEDDQDHCPCPIRMIYGILHYARKQGVTFIPMLLFLRGQHLVNGYDWLDEESRECSSVIVVAHGCVYVEAVRRETKGGRKVQL